MHPSQSGSEPTPHGDRIDPARPERAQGWLRVFDPRPRAGFLAQQWEILRCTLWILLVVLLTAVLGGLLLPLIVGNRAGEEIIEQATSSPARFVRMMVLFPCIEEVLFRGLPNWIADLVTRLRLRRLRGPLPGRRPMRWALGAFLAASFAVIHNVGKDPDVYGFEFAPGWMFSFEAIPLPQLLLGLFCWNIARKFGLLQAMFAHVVNNTLPLSLGLLLG